MEDCFFYIFDFGKLQNISIWEVTKEKPKENIFLRKFFEHFRFCVVTKHKLRRYNRGTQGTHNSPEEHSTQK
jgi:hypothetical protein